MVDQARADPRVERAARIVTGVATAWVVLIAFRGIAAPLGAGISGAPAAAGVAAENIWHWHFLAAVTHYTSAAPLPTSYAWQRPLGSFWVTALFVKLLGHQAIACRLAPALASIAIPPLLFAVGRALWGPVPAALSVAMFAVLPVVPVFANQDPAAAPAVAGVLLCSWAYAHLHRTWHVRWLVVALAGLLFALLMDWAAYAFALVLLVVALLQRTTPLRRWFPPVDAKRFAQWWAIAAGVAVLAFALQAVELQKAKALVTFLASALERMRGTSVPSDLVVSRRAYWHAVALTPIGLGVGVVALPLLLGRWLLVRRGIEVCVLALFAMGMADYAWVAQESGLRSFWPWYYAPYLALALGVIAATLEDAARWAARALGRTPPPLTSLGVLGVLLAVPALALVQGRAAGGTARRLALELQDDDLLVEPDLARTAMLQWLADRIDGPGTVAFSPETPREISDGWNLRHPVTSAQRRGHSGFTVIDARRADAAALQKVAGTTAIDVVGPYWILDHAAPATPIEANVFEVRDAVHPESYFKLPGGLAFAVQKDAWYTWELRDHFKQEPNPVPEGPLLTREQRRIAHNVAVETGNVATADRLENELLKDLDRSVATSYGDGIALLGQIVDPGPSPRLTLYFRAPGPIPGGLEFRIREVMERAPLLSFIAGDPVERHVGAAFPIDPALWKSGFIYAVTATIHPRAGRVRYFGYWHARSGGALPMPMNGPPQRTLLVLQ